MSFIPAPVGTTRAVFRGSLDGQEVVNVMYFANIGTGPPDVTGANGLMESYADAWLQAPATGQLNAAYTLLDVTVTDVEAAGGPTATSTSAPVSGGSTGVHTANQSALVVSWRTGLAGRSNRGRTYLGGLDNDILADANHVTSAFATAVTAGANNFIVAVQAWGWELSVASYYSGVDGNGRPVPRAEAVITPVTFAIVNTRLDSQRRRMPRS